MFVFPSIPEQICLRGRVLTLGFCAGCAIVLFGCPDPSGVGPDGGPNLTVDAGTADAGFPESYPVSSYCERIVEFFCPYYVRCGRMAVDSVEECRVVFNEACEGRYEPRYAGLEAAQLLRLSPVGLAACEEHLNNVACDEQIRDLDGPCADLWEGQVEEGNACGFDVESFVCAPGTQCVLGLDLCGTCEIEAALGAVCGGDDPRCSSAAECVDGLCQARPLAGQGCTEEGPRCVLGASCLDGLCTGPDVVTVGESCDQGRRCPFHSFCIGGECVLAASLGQMCTPGILECDSGYCSQGVCVALSLPGEVCQQNAECAVGRCGDDGLCEALPSTCF